MHALKFIKWILISIGATFLVLLSLLVFAYWYASSGVFSSESFEKTKWHAAISDEQSATCYRGGMRSEERRVGKACSDRYPARHDQAKSAQWGDGGAYTLVPSVT